MVQLGELSPEAQKQQDDIKASFIEREANLELLAFSGIGEDEAIRLWQEPGLVVGLEARFDAESGPTASLEKFIQNDAIAEAVAQLSGFTVDQLRGKRRSNALVHMRQLTAFVIREVKGLSYPKIADFIGYEDHTSAMHSVSRIQEAIDQRRRYYEIGDPKTFAEEVTSLAAQIQVDSSEKRGEGMNEHEVITITREGLMKYPSISLDPRHLAVLGLSRNAMVLDWENRVLSETVIRAYGGAALGKLATIQPVPA